MLGSANTHTHFSERTQRRDKKERNVDKLEWNAGGGGGEGEEEMGREREIGHRRRIEREGGME